ncbi:hypothetical protein D9M72_324650 [compost metagenome]
MRVAHHRGRRSQRALRIAWHHAALLRADAVGVGRHFAQAGRAQHVVEGARVAGKLPVRGAFARVADQLDQLHVGQPAAQRASHRAQAAALEALDKHRRLAQVGLRAQGRCQLVFKWQADAAEIARMLQFGIDADGFAGAQRGLLGQPHDLVEGRHLELVVQPRIGRPHPRDALTRAQCLELGQREVFGEPAAQALAVDHLGALALGELRQFGHVGGAGDVVLVARHQHAVACHDQVGLDGVGAVLDGLGVGGKRMFGAQRAGAAVGDHQRPGLGGGGGRRRGARRGRWRRGGWLRAWRGGAAGDQHGAGRGGSGREQPSPEGKNREEAGGARARRAQSGLARHAAFLW